MDSGTSELERLKEFARLILETHPHYDVDGDVIEVRAVALGLLESHVVTSPCREEGCNCAEYGDWPMTCYRMAGWLKQ